MILPPLGEYDVMVHIKACALSRIDTKVVILSSETCSAMLMATV